MEIELEVGFKNCLHRQVAYIKTGRPFSNRHFIFVPACIMYEVQVV